MKTAAIYARYSSDMQRDGYSIAAQLDACRERCAQHGYIIADEYIDEAKSGGNTNRPEFQRMMSDAAAGRFNVLVFHKIDRLSRNLLDFLTIINRLRQNNVLPDSVTENLDFVTPSGGVMLALQGSLAQMYRENLAIETTKGKKAKAKSGGHNGAVPIGYKLVVDADKPVRVDAKPQTKIVIDDVIGPCIAEAFAAYATGTYTDSEIANLLNQHGITTNSRWGNRAFSKDTVTAILKNKFYCGYVSYRGLSDRELASGKRAANPKAQKVWFRGSHEALIDEALFEKCLNIRHQRGRKFMGTHKANDGLVYLLQRLGRCAHCGGTLRSTRAGRGKEGYRCTSKERGLSCSCVKNRVAQWALLDQIAEIVQGLRLDDEMRDDARRIIAADEAAARYEAEKRKLDAELKRVGKMFQMGLMDEDRFERDVLRIRATQAELLPPPSLDGMEAALSTLGQMSELWTAATMTERQETLQAVFDEIFVDTDTNRITAATPKKEYAALVGAAYFTDKTVNTSGSDGFRTRGLCLDRAAC